MVKKLYQAFKSLSLTKQLIAISIIMLVVLVGIVSPIVENNVRAIVNRQIYHSIVDSQNQIASLYEDEFFFTMKPRGSVHELNINHIYYDANTNIATFLYEKNQGEAIELLNQVFLPELSKQVLENTTYMNNVTLDNDQVIYYAISETSNPGAYWISFGSSMIATELLKSIHQSLINVLWAITLLVTVVYFIWIFSILRPLAQIKNFIQSIKNHEDTTLNITSKDEIGAIKDALLDMKGELSRREKLQSDLIHNISHDLKTPIAIIRSYSESAKEEIYPYGDLNSSLDVVIENADRLEGKVKDFLYLNRLDYFDPKEHQEEVHLDEITLQLVKEFSGMYPELHFETQLQATVVRGLEEHWHSCLMNLLDNACRYASSTIRITMEDNTITIYDDGEPLEDVIKEHLFEPYTKGSKGNFGLGLSIVHKIVTMYQYQITAENKNDGVCFTITK